MTTTTLPQQDYAIIHVDPALDGQNAGQLRHQASDALENGKHGLIIDLTDTVALSMAGLQALINTVKQVRQFGARMALAAAHDQVQAQISEAGLNAFFAMYPNVPDAEEALHEPIPSGWPASQRGFEANSCN